MSELTRIALGVCLFACGGAGGRAVTARELDVIRERLTELHGEIEIRATAADDRAAIALYAHRGPVIDPVARERTCEGPLDASVDRRSNELVEGAVVIAIARVALAPPHAVEHLTVETTGYSLTSTHIRIAQLDSDPRHEAIIAFELFTDVVTIVVDAETFAVQLYDHVRATMMGTRMLHDWVFLAEQGRGTTLVRNDRYERGANLGEPPQRAPAVGEVGEEWTYEFNDEAAVPDHLSNVEMHRTEYDRAADCWYGALRDLRHR